MIGNNRHSDRTFVSEHICGRLAPSAGHADARLLARPPVFTLAASLSRSLSISFLLSFLAYLLSFSTPVFFSLARPRPPYAVPSRSPLALVPPPVSIPVRIGASSAPLSRRCSSFEASLSAAVHNHPPACSFGPRRIRYTRLAASPPRASSHSSRSRPPSLPTLRPCLYSFRNRSLFFSPLLSPISPPFSLALSFALPAVFFLRPTLFRPTFMYRLVSGMRDVHHTSARVRTCAPRPSFSRSSRAAGRRACSNRFDTRSWGKKNGRMYRRRLSPRRVNTPRPRVRARATRALGQWRNFSRFFLLPFCIGPAFRIYLRVIRFAAGYNMRLASRRMDAAGVR